MENKNLVRISTYAKQKNVSTVAVYKWIKQGKVQARQVDGMWFIVSEQNL